jgi:ubiquitin-like 1-activating enzyme E1 B
MATRCGLALVDAGTMGFRGQSYASVRFITSCHNCEPSRSEQSAAVCHIRSKPERPIHCATFATSFYSGIVGEETGLLGDSFNLSKILKKPLD